MTQVTHTDLSDDLSRLLRQEIELAKQEARREGRKVAQASSMVAGAVFASVLAAILLSFALVYALGVLMPLAWAAFIVAVIWLFLGIVLGSEARRKLKTTEPLLKKLLPQSHR